MKCGSTGSTHNDPQHDFREPGQQFGVSSKLRSLGHSSCRSPESVTRTVSKTLGLSVDGVFAIAFSLQLGMTPCPGKNKPVP